MKDRLPGEYHQSLDTTTRLPGPDDLQKAIYHRARWFNTSFGMAMPSINQNLLLLNYVRHLALPLEVYTTVRRLNTITKYDFTYPTTATPLETTRRQPTTYPESQLMSLVVVATKLLFPFDSATVKRYPKDANDPTALRMDWSSWLEAKGRFDKDSSTARETNGLKAGSEILVTDRDILGMTDQQLDQYMSWYQRTWIKTSATSPNTQVQEGGSGSMDREVLDMFPLPDVPEPREGREQNEKLYAEEDTRLTDRIKQVQRALGPRRAISEEEELERGLDVLRPGARYPRFAKAEDVDPAEKVAVNGDVAKIFHEEAAQTACLSLKALISAVNRTEEKIELWLAARRREDVFGEDKSASDGSGVAVEDSDIDEDVAVVPETSPPGKLAKVLDELGLGLSPHAEDDDGDVDMQMLPE
jgi:RNA polymerase I-specific transcription initiation factor RRN7